MAKSTRQSAGILLYHMPKAGPLKVLLVHPGGPYFKDKDTGAWSIPKGEFTADEAPLAAAIREFQEELGQPVPSTDFHALTPVKQKAGKIVHAWAACGYCEVSNFQSNTFRIEYPYKSGRWITVPEVDKAEWFTPEEARLKINEAQAALISELEALLRAGFMP